MLSLPYLLFIIFLAIALIILASNYLKVHPFLALILSCFFVGFASGMDGLTIVRETTRGFGNILTGIGLIVVLGTIIGVFIEKSGALDVIAEVILKLLGSKRTTMAMGVMGAVVSIPVFCDSGFIILSKLSRALAAKRKLSSASMSLALAAGLYTTHTLIPPTPGPIAVAGTIGATDHIGMIILTGVLISIPVLGFCIFLANRLGSKIEVKELEGIENSSSLNLHFLWATAPILLPILLITLSSILKVVGTDSSIVSFLGHPVIALLIGCILAMIQVAPKIKLKEQSELFKEGIAQAGPIILITGAGGAFGSVLKATPLTDLLSAQFGGSSLSFSALLLLAFVLAAILKTAQGSSTSALVIASAILAPFIAQLGVTNPFQLSLLVMAFGGGAMVVSHANDSYFWVVTQFSGISMKEGYRSFSLITFAQGVTTLTMVFLLYFFSTLF